MTVEGRVSSKNFSAFLWHTAFLALASNFMDVDTVLPAMLIESGGNAMHLGVLTMVLLGGGSFTQLFFAPYLSNQPFKKRYLIGGINARVLSLTGLGGLLYFSAQVGPGAMLWFIILLLSAFSLSGAFASVCYTDILGKSIDESARKPFFSIRQVTTGVGAFISAFLAQRMLVLEAYPKNYAFMFLTGSLALFLASFGFWKLKETIPSGMVIRSLRHFLSVMSREMRETPRLAYFLGFINTQGLTLAFLPFVMLYAKTSFQAHAGDTGMFLMFKVAGLVSVSLLIFSGKKGEVPHPAVRHYGHRSAFASIPSAHSRKMDFISRLSCWRGFGFGLLHFDERGPAGIIRQPQPGVVFGDCRGGELVACAVSSGRGMADPASWVSCLPDPVHGNSGFVGVFRA
ncbi:MAG: hypothetical protein IPK21_17425 [Haliscomenobacter sp.]|nr:hypothetical protein [Haliscomenobacter sp.]